ncbi:hypothetical protein J6590_036768 [Homalodisca vitripennis]|nr:hypothetical protein J6590_036768 [Homalodisca vitripennis]
MCYSRRPGGFCVVGGCGGSWGGCLLTKSIVIVPQSVVWWVCASRYTYNQQHVLSRLLGWLFSNKIVIVIVPLSSPWMLSIHLQSTTCAIVVVLGWLFTNKIVIVIVPLSSPWMLSVGSVVSSRYTYNQQHVL